MKWKCLIVVSLVIAFFAMGGVGATQDMTQNDNLTANDLNENEINEDIGDEKLSEEDFNINVTDETVDLDDASVENQSMLSLKFLKMLKDNFI